MKEKLFFSSLFLLASTLLNPLTIEEKKALSSQKEKTSVEGIDYLVQAFNKELTFLRQSLKECYLKVKALSEKNASSEEYQKLLEEVNQIKTAIANAENSWREQAVEESKKEEEGYALWDQEETTLGQLVMEYGSVDFLYLVPQDMSTLKINMHSSIPIPRESWSDVLEIILAHNGIGVKKINPYAKQLYFLKQDPSVIQAIASHPDDLLTMPAFSRLFYVFSPPAEQVKSTFQFFERFADAKQTFVHQVGSKIAIVAMKEEIEKLLALYKTVWEDAIGKVSRVVSITKMPVKEMERILTSFFGEAIEKNRPPIGKPEQEGLILFSLGQGNNLVLIGREEVVERAERIIQETEDQLQNPVEMTVYVYTCRHSDPSDLAKVLDKVYNALLTTSTEGRENVDLMYSSQGSQFKTPDGYSPSQPLPVTPQPLKPGSIARLDVEAGSDHFIPDLKTGNLLMVVRRDVLQKIKGLLRQLDVPKKMVQIEVLLFERRLNSQDSFGLNLLKVGSRRNGARYTSLFAPTGKGVLEYLFHKGRRGHAPAIDFAYNFLMSQEDIQFHAAPSVITVNQTPATINIVQEISINNGAAPIDTNKGIAFEQSYTRAQYGINIILTPTVHVSTEEGEYGGDVPSVTLQTNITFDTPKSDMNDRPLVDRRHIENEVRVIDGQTVIIGGLRRKVTEDLKDRVPFLGEIPGLGKLFGSTDLTDTNTEMFFFITPHIVSDPLDVLDKLRAEELQKRPGDVPEFLEKVIEAREKESKKYFEHSLKIFLETT